MVPNSSIGWIRRMLNGGGHHNIKIVDSSVYYNAYTLLISGKYVIWYNILKIHANGMETFKNPEQKWDDWKKWNNIMQDIWKMKNNNDADWMMKQYWECEKSNNTKAFEKLNNKG